MKKVEVGVEVTKLRRHDPDIYSAFSNPRCRLPLHVRRDLSRNGCRIHMFALEHVDGVVCMFVLINRLAELSVETVPAIEAQVDQGY